MARWSRDNNNIIIISRPRETIKSSTLYSNILLLRILWNCCCCRNTGVVYAWRPATSVFPCDVYYVFIRRGACLNVFDHFQPYEGTAQLVYFIISTPAIATLAAANNIIISNNNNRIVIVVINGGVSVNDRTTRFLRTSPAEHLPPPHHTPTHTNNTTNISVVVPTQVVSRLIIIIQRSTM